MRLFRFLGSLAMTLVCLVNIGWVSHQNPRVDDYIQKGYTAWATGNLTEAMNDYESALMFKPDQTDALNFLGTIYEEMGLPTKAEKKYLTAISIDKKFLPAYFNLGMLYWNQGDLPKAVYYFQQRIQNGQADDLWTIKAQRALEKIRPSQSMNTVSDTEALQRRIVIKRALDQMDQ